MASQCHPPIKSPSPAEQQRCTPPSPRPHRNLLPLASPFLIAHSFSHLPRRPPRPPSVSSSSSNFSCSSMNDRQGALFLLVWVIAPLLQHKRCSTILKDAYRTKKKAHKRRVLERGDQAGFIICSTLSKDACEKESIISSESCLTLQKSCFSF